jgi:hypothetical protein
MVKLKKHEFKAFMEDLKEDYEEDTFACKYKYENSVKRNWKDNAVDRNYCKKIGIVYEDTLNYYDILHAFYDIFEKFPTAFQLKGLGFNVDFKDWYEKK